MGGGEREKDGGRWGTKEVKAVAMKRGIWREEVEMSGRQGAKISIWEQEDETWKNVRGEYEEERGN